jgi:beta-lactamase class A
MLSLLELYCAKKILAPETHRVMDDILTTTPTGRKRIRGLLADEVIVGHKTGTSGIDASGKMAAINDAAFIKLPDGSLLYIVTFFSETRLTMQETEAILARASKRIYDHFTGR